MQNASNLAWMMAEILLWGQSPLDVITLEARLKLKGSRTQNTSNSAQAPAAVGHQSVRLQAAMATRWSLVASKPTPQDAGNAI